jgi:hypothetical protein
MGGPTFCKTRRRGACPAIHSETEAIAGFQPVLGGAERRVGVHAVVSQLDTNVQTCSLIQTPEQPPSYQLQLDNCIDFIRELGSGKINKSILGIISRQPRLLQFQLGTIRQQVCPFDLAV